MGKLKTCKACGETVAKSASVCPHCGAKIKKRHTVLIVILIVLILGGVAAVQSETGEGGALDNETVTKAEFDAIKTGMTYDEVVKIIGFEGELGSQVDLNVGEQYKTEIYIWSNPAGTNMNATFQGGKLVSKAQAGLS